MKNITKKRETIAKIIKISYAKKNLSKNVWII